MACSTNVAQIDRGDMEDTHKTSIMAFNTWPGEDVLEGAHCGGQQAMDSTGPMTQLALPDEELI